jgi:hypothetical protein
MCFLIKTPAWKHPPVTGDLNTKPSLALGFLAFQSNKVWAKSPSKGRAALDASVLFLPIRPLTTPQPLYGKTGYCPKCRLLVHVEYASSMSGGDLSSSERESEFDHWPVD